MSPFDEARYARLLEGLEVTELMLAEIQKDNEKLRIDSGYFAKPMLEADKKVRDFPNGFDDLGILFDRFVKGIFDINADSYVEIGIPFVRIQNLKNGLIDERNIAFIPEHIHTLEKKTELHRGDIVLSKTAYPAASLFTLTRGNTSQDTIATTLSEYGRTSYCAQAIVAYLNSKVGQTLLWRQFQGNVQLHLSLEDGRKVPMPRLSNALQTAIKACFEKAEKSQIAARQRSDESEAILMNGLGLDSWTPPKTLSYVQNSLEAFAAGRIDAEHFSPEAAAIKSLLEATNQAQPLHEILLLNQRGQQPSYSDEGLPVVNSKHVSRGEVRLDDENRLASYDGKTLLIQHGDVLINGTGVGTIGRAAPYLYPCKAIPDNHVTILRPKPGIDPIYLSVFLNSIAGQIQVEQWQRGSSGQIELYPNDIAQFLAWIAPNDLQTKVKQAIELSFQESQRSNALLDAACRAIEIAIQDSEEVALNYIEAQK